MFNFLQSHSLYTLVDMYRQMHAPVHELIESGLDFYSHSLHPLNSTEFGRAVVANLQALHGLGLTLPIINRSSGLLLPCLMAGGSRCGRTSWRITRFAICCTFGKRRR